MGENTFYILRHSLMVALCGFIAGLGLVAVVTAQGLNGPLPGGLVTSLVLPAAIGLLLAGPVSDRVGRRKTLMAAALLFALSGIVSAVSPGMHILTAARMIGGLGAGAALVIASMYIAELSPAGSRGRMVALIHLLFALGLLGATLSRQWYPEAGWRWMFIGEALLSLLWLGALFVVPESPRWLAMQGLKQDALAVLRKTTSMAQADVDLQAIQASIHDEITRQGVSFADLFRPAMRMVMLIGLGLAVAQPLTGFIAVISHASMPQAAIVMTVFTLIAVLTIDQLGRRPLLLAGLGLMAASLVLLMFGFSGDSISPALVQAGNLGFIAGFSLSLGPVMWVLFSELFPNPIRGIAMSFVGGVNLAVVFVVYLLLPRVPAGPGSSLAYLVYGLFAVAALVVVAKFVPETRGKSLEELEWDLVGR